MKKPVKIGLFGAGRVGSQLLKRFDDMAGVEIMGVWTRHPERHPMLEGRSDVIRRPEDMPQADVYMLALKDDAISDFSKHLTGRRGLTVHTSGAVPSTVLQTERRGVFYPLQTFTEHSVPDWDNIPLLVHASQPSDTELLERLGRMLSSRVYRVNDRQRAQLHVAAVFASNFTNVMVQIALKLNRRAGLPDELLRPLLETTFRNLLEGEPEIMLTGPARRGDLKTLEKHLALLSQGDTDTEKEIYEQISRWIREQYG